MLSAPIWRFPLTYFAKAHVANTVRKSGVLYLELTAIVHALV